MSSSLDEFKTYAKKHPKLRKDVLQGKRTWQSIYEDWVLFGEDKGNDNISETNYDYTNSEFIDDTNDNNLNEISESSNISQTLSTEKTSGDNQEQNSDLINSIMGVVKNVNPSTISQALNYAQKASTIIQSFSQIKGNNTPPKAQSYYDPFFRKF